MARRNHGLACLIVLLTFILVPALLYGRWCVTQSTPQANEKFEAGDHIYIHRGSYDHHGIVYATDRIRAGVVRRVAHISSPRGDLDDMSNSTFVVTDVDQFLLGSPYNSMKRMHYGRPWSAVVWELHTSPMLLDSQAVIMARVEWLLRHHSDGLMRYDLLGQNCEHAAHWCSTGQQWSRQSLVPQSDAAPFRSREDTGLAAQIRTLRRSCSKQIPRQDDILNLHVQSSGAALDFLTGVPGMGFVHGRGVAFRVHSRTVEVAQDPRQHTVLGFECVDRPCFLGSASGQLVCISRTFGRKEWFVAHSRGILQHFESGCYVVETRGNAKVLCDDHFPPVVFRWPHMYPLWSWHLYAGVAVFFVGLCGIPRVGSICLPRQRMEPLTHLLHLTLVLASCFTLWLGGEVRAFACLFLVCLIGLPVGQMCKASRKRGPVFTFVMSTTLFGFILWRASTNEEPMLTALAQGVVAWLLVYVLMDLLLVAFACCGRRIDSPSRIPAEITVPVLVTSVVFKFIARCNVKPSDILIRGATVAAGVAHLTWVGKIAPSQQGYGKCKSLKNLIGRQSLALCLQSNIRSNDTDRF